MTRHADSKHGEPAQPKPGHNDYLKPKSAAESDFQTLFTPGAVPGAPVKLGAKEYDADMWDSPLIRTLKRAVTGWPMPAPGSGNALKAVLPEADPRLVPTAARPGREAWRANLQQLVVSAGAVQSKPTVYVIAGPLGVGKRELLARLYTDGALPASVVKADSEFLHALVPEHSELLALGDSRAGEVVHEEASAVARGAFKQALNERRDVVHCTRAGGPTQLDRLATAKAAGFRRVVIALVSPVDVAKARAGADGAAYSEGALLESHRDFARGFEELVKRADELVLLLNQGAKVDVIAQAKGGQLTVKSPAAFAKFRAQKDLPA